MPSSRVYLMMAALVSGIVAIPFEQSTAAVPSLINYQGILTDGAGAPIVNSTSVQFRIWNQAVGGSELWSETQSINPNPGGSFGVILGSINPIPDSVFDGDEAYLGVTVSPDVEMMPRSRLVATAYAFRVGTIEGANAGALSGDIVLKPSAPSAKQALDPGDPQIIIVSTPGDSIYFGPADQLVFRAVDNVNGEYMIALDDPGKGPLLGIRVDGTEYAEHAVASSTYYTGTGAKDGQALSKKLEVGRDGAFVYGATDADTLSRLNTTGLQVRDNTGNVSEIRARTAEFKNSSGETTARIGDEGIQVFATGGAKRSPQAVDTVFSFDPATNSLIIGVDNIASGPNSIAVGVGNTAAGTNSIAVGTDNVANKSNCVALGNGNVADSNDATVTGGRGNVARHFGATVGGGIANTSTGEASTVAGGVSNSALHNNSTVGGGYTNSATEVGATVCGGVANASTGVSATIAGGEENTADGWWSSIGGGLSNYVDLGGSRCVIGGGLQDSILGGEQSVIAGGYLNRLDAFFASIGGGQENNATGWWSTIPGGRDNEAGDQYALAAGRRAKATHAGSFVWGDSTDSDVSSSTVNEFTVRASGGTRFYSDTGLTSGVTLAPGGGSWGTVSDRNVKQNIRPVDGSEILKQLADLPVARWSYKSQDPSIEHIGPMAQDFYRLFGVGDNDKTITTVDPDGVALAAIQALYRRNQELESTIAGMKNQLEKLEVAVKAVSD